MPIDDYAQWKVVLEMIVEGSLVWKHLTADWPNPIGAHNLNTKIKMKLNDFTKTYVQVLKTGVL